MAAAMAAVPQLPHCVVAAVTGTAEGLSDPLASRPQGMDSPAAAEVREGAILGLPSALEGFNPLTTVLAFAFRFIHSTLPPFLFISL